MLRDITIGRYVKSNSVLHRADSRTKIISAIIFPVAVLLCENLISVAFAALFFAVGAVISKLPFKYILRGLKPIRWFLLFMFAVNIFTAQGNILFNWGIITITADGICNAVLITAKFALFMLWTSLFTLTTPPLEIADGFIQLTKPLKVLHIPVEAIAVSISLMLRFIPMTADEYERIQKAQAARTGQISQKGLIRKIKSAAVCAVPLFVNAFRHTDELSLAMEARCYGKPGRNPRKKLKFTQRDYLLLFSMVLFCVFLAFIEFLH